MKINFTFTVEHNGKEKYYKFSDQFNGQSICKMELNEKKNEIESENLHLQSYHTISSCFKFEVKNICFFTTRCQYQLQHTRRI